MATTRHRSLVERGGREAFVIDKGLPHKKEQEKNIRIYTTLKKNIRAHRASSKATRLFLTK